MESADARIKEAWIAYNFYTQLQLDFDAESHDSEDDGGGDTIQVHLVADPSPTGRDPSYEQLSLEHFAFTEAAGLTERQQEIVEILLYEDVSNVEIAKRLGVSEYTVRVEIKAIKLSGITKGWLPDLDKELREEGEGECQSVQ